MARSLESFTWWRERLIATEQMAGWLAECEDAGRFLAVNRELVEALAHTLRQLAGDGPVLEICAGSGELARALSAAGVRIQATDADPGSLDSSGRPEPSSNGPRHGPSGGRELQVLSMSGDTALRSFEPSVVLGVFVPFDSGMDEAVLASPTVEHYVVLNARIGGSLGSPSLWQATDWRAEPLETVQRWMLTKHDVWLGSFTQSGGASAHLLQHGEAWHFRRITTISSRSARSC